MCLRPIIVFFPIVIHNCHVCSISYHLRCWTLTFVQQESKHAWSCLGKTSHPKEHIQHLCGKVAIYRSHQTTSSKQFEFLGDRGGRVCLVVLPYRSLVHHRIWELFSASLTLESQGLPRIWRDFRIVHHAYHVNTTHGISFLWDRRSVPKKRTFFREGARSHALVGWIRDTIPMEVLQAGCLLTITLLILWCWIAEPKKT